MSVARSETPIKAKKPSDTASRRPGSDTGARAASINASLLAICQAMGSNLDREKVLDTILDLSTREMRAQEGSILLYDAGRDRLEMLASKGLPDAMIARGYIPRKGSIAEWVIDNDKPTILNGAVGEKKYFSANDDRTIVSSMCVPLRARGHVLGTINLNRTDPAVGPFRDRDLDSMIILASQAAISIENSQLHEAKLQGERLAAIGQTVAGVSHCIKNMLTSLRGGLSVCELARKGENWEMYDQGVDVLQRAVKRVSTLALDMLDYSKDRTHRPSWLRLDELFADLAVLKEQAAHELDIKLQCEAPEEAKAAFADPDQLFRCVLNLLENAIDASPTGGKILLSAWIDTSPEALRRLRKNAPAATVIRVADGGAGVAPEDAGRLFEPFFSTKGSKGTGLGLAVTRKIIREHGGDLELASKPGESAVFAIYLPLPDPPSG